MPSTSLAISDNTAISKPKQTSQRINPRVRRTLDLMVWDNKCDNDAAVQVGISVLYLRAELKKPHIRSYYRGQLEVLRERESSRNIHTLIEVRDQKANQMARVQAVKALEQIDDVEHGSRGIQSQPGMQIVIVTGSPLTQVSAHPMKTIEHSDG